jgi:hypothetical protein
LEEEIYGMKDNIFSIFQEYFFNTRAFAIPYNQERVYKFQTIEKELCLFVKKTRKERSELIERHSTKQELCYSESRERIKEKTKA